MLDNRFDFSKDTDIKAALWEKMAAVAEKNAARKEVSFDELDGSLGKKMKKDEGRRGKMKEEKNRARGL